MKLALLTKEDWKLVTNNQNHRLLSWCSLYISCWKTQIKQTVLDRCKICCTLVSGRLKQGFLKKALNMWDQDPEGFVPGVRTGAETWLYHIILKTKDGQPLKGVVVSSWKWFSPNKSATGWILKVNATVKPEWENAWESFTTLMALLTPVIRQGLGLLVFSWEILNNLLTIVICPWFLFVS